MANTVRRIAAYSAASAAAVGLTFGVNVARTGDYVQTCPQVDSTLQPGAGSNETKAGQAFDLLGAQLVGILATKCEAPARNEDVIVTRLGDGAMQLTLWRTVIHEGKAGNLDGSYVMSVTAAQTADGKLNPAKTTALRVAMLATVPTEGVANMVTNVPTFDMHAQRSGANWIVKVDDVGYHMQGNTGASLAEQQAADLMTNAQYVVDAEDLGAAIIPAG